VKRPASLPPPSDRFVVVEASAGTGKTFFLEHRVVDLILGAGAQLGQILLVTFTDKAVAELRLRIRDLLDRLSRAEAEVDGERWTLDDDARRSLRAAVAAFDHAPIYTIHGFCHRVLIEDAFAARRLFDQTQVADEVAFDAAFAALLRERFARELPDRDLLGAFLESDRSVEDLRDLLLRCARANAHARKRFDPDAVRATAQTLYATLGTRALRDAVLAQVTDRRWAPGWLDRIGDALARGTPDDAPGRLLGMIDKLREPAQLLCKRLKPAQAQIAAALREVERTITVGEAIAAELLPAVLERIGADKAERGLFDYDDMLVLVAGALRGPRGEELAARLRARTPWVMIDEFQDTDPIQWQIFRTVWMHDEARGLTIVGDPKQAIYGFRGADVATYEAAREELLRAGGTRVALDVNHRSTPQLVEAVNEILLPGPMQAMLDRSITYDTPVRASGLIESDDRRPPVRAYQLLTNGRKDIDAQRAALAKAIGDAIEELRADPPTWRVRGTERPFRLGDVMVLTRSNKEMTDIAQALRGRGLPCALVESERLFTTREAAELAAVLAAIAAPRDRSARLRALRTRFFDVPWADLMRVVDAPDHHPLIARLFAWSALASRRAYEALFRELVEDSRYAERALVLGGGERAVINTWHVIELLLAEVARARCDLSELVVQLRRWIADESTTDERDVQRAETDADAVRVLTIHKAKGLEAPYVFVYGGSSPPPKNIKVTTLRDAAGRALVVGTPDEATQRRLEDEATAENQRLAYVALTRAQVRLYLPWYSELGDTTAYWPIQRCLEPWLSPRVGRDCSRFERVEIAVSARADSTPPLAALSGFEPPAPPVVEPLAELAPGRRGLTMLSYTRLAHDLDVVHSLGGLAVSGDAIDPAEFDVDDAAGVPPDEMPAGELPPGASSGLLLHDLLEIADIELARRAPDAAAWAAEPEVAAQLVTAARERGIMVDRLPHAARLVHGALTRPLALVGGDTLPPLADAPALAREVEFAYPLPGSLRAAGAGESRRGLVRGYIDALVAWDDALWVVDYKSDLLAGDNLAAAAERRVREHYGVQMRLYAIAAERLRGKRRLAGLLFAFLRHDIVVPIRANDELLAEWTRWLAAIGDASEART
jgi:exodeoxyribonuclease V beta subunit